MQRKRMVTFDSSQKCNAIALSTDFYSLFWCFLFSYKFYLNIGTFPTIVISQKPKNDSKIIALWVRLVRQELHHAVGQAVQLLLASDHSEVGRLHGVLALIRLHLLHRSLIHLQFWGKDWSCHLLILHLLDHYCFFTCTLKFSMYTLTISWQIF